MIKQLIKADSVIIKVIRDFNLPSTGWVSDAYEWIGDVIAIIGVSQALEKRSCAFTTRDNRALIPDAVHENLSVELGGIKIPLITPSHGPKSSFNELNILLPLLRYYVEGNYVLFTPDVADGVNGYFHYDSFALDENRMPMVPSDQFFQEAAAWYILRAYLMRGNSHPVLNFQYADQMWHTLYPRAQNSLITPSLDDAERFKEAWVQLIPNLNRSFDDFRDTALRNTNY